MGQEAVELCRMAGLALDPWQEFVLASSLGFRDDGKWAAFEVGLVVPRQNGKGALLEARELAGLFLLREQLIIHSAHQFDTSLEAFWRLRALIEEHDEFSRRVKKIVLSHGEEGITLTNGQRIRFRTRTKGGGRGFSCDCLILDEAMELSVKAHGALLPTLSARENPQVFYTGSAVDEEVHENGVVFASIRERGLAGDDPALAFFEWSAAADKIDEVDPDDREEWGRANPGMGIRITEEHIAREQRSMDSRTFAVERLGVGAWPSLEDPQASGITPAMLKDTADEASGIDGALGFAIDVRPDRSRTAICAAGDRDDELWHLEVVEHRAGTGWVAERMAELTRAHRPVAVIVDRRSPAAALIGKLEDAGVKVTTVDSREYADACGAFFDAFDQRRVRHLDEPEFTSAVRGAMRRPLGDAWAWSRKSSAVDITPLVGCTLALWGLQENRAGDYLMTFTAEELAEA